ncbi:hypothetical protein AWM79_09295 [Pseudomonas agarici]|uniref:DUF1090 domain-containing protein n=1 Tax=Pseudomonas agarici TaxID=46677 RepID=A0A0X1T093_PSEAA|nr:hypothetical protein [Pseudomonas agarici]AMB85483.1 hypothetical protein AWM79_09295 [Pseudomonas agarici]NWB91520.1 hypothetical protein [Pseudomonas agarici]NWC11682.1 hypothetical protein [Pseudomonas agarici]SEL81076.1 hypothetical protein SAMN05216604_13536 [Pseudomonas agarici]
MRYKFALLASIAISVFSIQSHAADNLCDLNLEKIDEVLVTASQNLEGGATDNLKQAKKEALAAKKAGDIDKCINLTQRVLSNAENSTMGGGGSR